MLYQVCLWKCVLQISMTFFICINSQCILFQLNMFIWRAQTAESNKVRKSYVMAVFVIFDIICIPMPWDQNKLKELGWSSCMAVDSMIWIILSIARLVRLCFMNRTNSLCLVYFCQRLKLDLWWSAYLTWFGFCQSQFLLSISTKSVLFWFFNVRFRSKYWGFAVNLLGLPMCCFD